jgi:hypothetical protein
MVQSRLVKLAIFPAPPSVRSVRHGFGLVFPLTITVALALGCASPAPREEPKTSPPAPAFDPTERFYFRLDEIASIRYDGTWDFTSKNPGWTMRADAATCSFALRFRDGAERQFDVPLRGQLTTIGGFNLEYAPSGISAEVR